MSSHVWALLGKTYSIDQSTLKKVLSNLGNLQTTTVVEVEAVMPLTYTSSDATDAEPVYHTFLWLLAVWKANNFLATP